MPKMYQLHIFYTKMYNYGDGRLGVICGLSQPAGIFLSKFPKLINIFKYQISETCGQVCWKWGKMLIITVR